LIQNPFATNQTRTSKPPVTTKELSTPNIKELRIGYVLPVIRHKNLIFALISLYFFVSSIVFIKESIVLMGQDRVRDFLSSINDTTTGVFAGWFGTALLQSSGAFDSIIIAFVSVGVMQTYVAVAAIIGAEVGTTVTTQLVSVFGYIRKERQRFQTSFLVAMLHYWYNFCTLMIFLTVELLFKVFTYIAQTGSLFFSKIPGISAIPSIFNLITPWVHFLLQYIPAWIGLVGGCVLLLISLKNSEKYLSAIFASEVSKSLIRSTFGSTPKAFLAGLIFTIIVPSTSVMISILIPLVTTGIIDTSYYILPYILGANIGTVFDVMIAALATGNPAAIGVWLIHLTINVVGACIFLPLLKPFSALVQTVNNFLTFSKKRTIAFLVLSNGIPATILILGILL